MLSALILSAAIFAAPPAPAANRASGLLQFHPDGRTLAVGNPDSRSVSVVQTDDRGRGTKLAEVAVPGQPEAVAWLGASRKLAVTLYDRRHVAVVDTAVGKLDGALISVGPEPYGVLSDDVGQKLFVTLDEPGELVEVDVAKRAVARRLPLGRFLRGLAREPNGRLLLTHYYNAALTAVDVAVWKAVDRWGPASETDNLARHVVAHPSKPYAYVTHLRSRTEFHKANASIFPFVSVIDLGPQNGDGRRRHPLAMDLIQRVAVPCNPHEAALAPDGKTLYVVYAGTDDMNVFDVLADDHKYLKPRGRLVEVGRNPRAVAARPDGKVVAVYNALDFAVSLRDPKTARELTAVKVSKPPYSATILRGKRLFDTSNHPMTTRQWVACSSCHPDGGHDGRTWQNPDGLRRTTGFWGMADTYPIHWSGDRDEMQDFEETIRGPLMRGAGLLGEEYDLHPSLGKPNAGRSADLDALAAYCNSLTHRRSPYAGDRPGVVHLSEAAKRGREIFLSKEANCASCHSGKHYTDRQRHDVGTGRADKTETAGHAYDTPTLLSVYRQTAYLHDGTATTLDEVLTKNPGDRHGKTSHMTAQMRADLVTFLKALPFE